MMALNKEMMKQFRDKFGDEPIYFKGGMTMHQLKYVTWVEDLAESLQKELEAAKAEKKRIIKELINVSDFGILPDGDHINVPTQLWLEKLLNSELDINKPEQKDQS
jgi:hypothetical protein